MKKMKRGLRVRIKRALHDRTSPMLCLVKLAYLKLNTFVVPPFMFARERIRSLLFHWLRRSLELCMIPPLAIDVFINRE